MEVDMTGPEFIFELGHEDTYADGKPLLPFSEERKIIRELITRRFAQKCIHPNPGGGIFEHNFEMADWLVGFYAAHPHHGPGRESDNKILHSFLRRYREAAEHTRRTISGDMQRHARACLYTGNVDLVQQQIQESGEFLVTVCRYAVEMLMKSGGERLDDIDTVTPHGSIENIMKLVFRLKYSRFGHMHGIADLLTKFAAAYVNFNGKVSYADTIKLPAPPKMLPAPEKVGE